MTMCEMETSVYYFAISILQYFPGCYQISELCFYQLICFYFFFINLVLKWFLKAGSSAELPLSCLCLEHKCSRSQKCGTKEVFKWGSEFWVMLLCCVSSGLCSVERRLLSFCLWEHMNSGESRAKCGTTWGSSLYSIPQHCLVNEAKTAALPCP